MFRVPEILPMPNVQKAYLKILFDQFETHHFIPIPISSSQNFMDLREGVYGGGDNIWHFPLFTLLGTNPLAKPFVHCNAFFFITGLNILYVFT